MLSVIAHRGSGVGPLENTLRGMKQALAWGVDGVEFDVRTSQDGELVIFHDETVDRTTDGTGPIMSYTLKELRELDAGEGEQIPTLREMLALLKPHANLIVNAEIKPAGIEDAVLQVIQEMDMVEQTVISAFNHEVLQRVHALNAESSTALFYTVEDDPVSLAKELGCKGLHPLFSAATNEMVWTSKQEGLFVIPWTVNFEEEMLQLIGLMVDGIITDDPPLLLGLLYPEGGL